MYDDANLVSLSRCPCHVDCTATGAKSETLTGLNLSGTTHIAAGTYGQ